jgi:hypothetical protein
MLGCVRRRTVRESSAGSQESDEVLCEGLGQFFVPVFLTSSELEFQALGYGQIQDYQVH